MHLFFLYLSLVIPGQFSGLADARPLRAQVLQDAFPGKKSSILIMEVCDERGRNCGASYTDFIYPKDCYFLKGEILYWEDHKWNTTGTYISQGDSLRSRIYAFIKNSISKVLPNSMLMDSLLLGYPHKAVQDIFRSCGLSFLLALSGMHLTLIVQFCKPLLSPFSKRWKELMLVVFVLFFVWISGFRHSLFRAMLMFLLRLYYAQEGEGKDNLSLLVVSAAIHLLLFPDAWTGLSFQLSYGAMFGIFIFTPFISLHLKWIRFPLFKNILALSLGAQAMVSPWIFWTLGQFHPFSLISTLVLAPLITLFLWLALLALFLSFINPLIPFMGRVLILLEENILKIGSILGIAPHIELGKYGHKRLLYTGVFAIPAIIMFWLIFRRKFLYGKKLKFKLRFPFRNTDIAGHDGAGAEKKMGTEFSNKFRGKN